MTDFHERKNTKARKRHRCDGCCLDIEPGEVYDLQKGVFYGDFYVTKLHRFCAEIVDKAYDEYGYCDGVDPQSEVQEWRHEFWRQHGLHELEKAVSC